MYERLAFFVPKPIIGEFKRQMGYNGIKSDEQKFVGMLVFYSIIIAFIAAATEYSFTPYNGGISFAAGLLLPISIVYLVLKIRSESRGKFVEKLLPDALQLIASNMKSGLTTERALFVAARPEFGPMQTELLTASKKISTGERLDIALNGISEGINSAVVGKTIWLISQGIRSGAQMADLLLQLSNDLKSEQGLQEEISANVSIYILLILFASALGAPALFGVSTFISQVMTKQLSSGSLDSGVPVTSSSPFVQSLSGKRTILDPGFVTNFAILMLLFSSFFSSLTIGVINTGKETSGFKYIIPITVVALMVFFVTRAILIGNFSALI